LGGFGKRAGPFGDATAWEKRADSDFRHVLRRVRAIFARIG
jgi:hypothetical protein